MFRDKSSACPSEICDLIRATVPLSLLDSAAAATTNATTMHGNVMATRHEPTAAARSDILPTKRPKTTTLPHSTPVSLKSLMDLCWVLVEVRRAHSCGFHVSINKHNAFLLEWCRCNHRTVDASARGYFEILIEYSHNHANVFKK